MLWKILKNPYKDPPDNYLMRGGISRASKLCWDEEEGKKKESG